MGNRAPIQSVAREFVQTLRDLSQYLGHQRSLGNRDLKISKSSLDLIHAWGGDGKKSMPFICQGPDTARVFIVDSEGSFFKGEAGALLVKILTAMNLTPESVFICNASELRPIHTRIKRYQPLVVVTLGERAGQLLLNTPAALEKFQGRFHLYHGVSIMPTLHPSVLLVQPQLKRTVWEEMQQVMKQAGLAPHV